jgi:hypothetical protein
MVGICTNRDVGAPRAVHDARLGAAMLKRTVPLVSRCAGVGSLVRRGGLSFFADRRRAERPGRRADHHPCYKMINIKKCNIR